MPDMAWDIEPRKDVKLFVGCPIIPSFQYIHTRVQEAWEHAWKPPQTVRVFERSFGIASARENLADKFLEGDWTHLLWLDADIMVRENTIKRLIEVDREVCTGLYYETSDRRQPEAFHHCFTSNTKIKYLNQRKEVVHSTFGDYNRLRNNRNTKVFCGSKILDGHFIKEPLLRDEDIVDIRLWNGFEYTTTLDHPNFTLDGIKSSKKLTNDDFFIFNLKPYEENKSIGEYDWGFFVGLYVAEGSFDRTRISIPQKITSENQKVLQRIKDLLESIGVRASINIDRDSYVLRAGRLAQEYIKNFVEGTSSRNKRLCHKVWNTSFNFRQGIYDGEKYGDGCESSGEISTISTRLKDDLIRLMLSIGLFPHVGYGTRDNIWILRPYSFSPHASSRGRIKKIKNERVAVKIKTIGKRKPSSIETIVYDFEVNSNDHLFELGDNLVTHNSQVPFRRDAPIDFKKNEYFEFPDDSEDYFLGGLGLVMFKREVFDKIEKPYFLYSSEYESKLKDDFASVSEDFYVLLKLQQAGIKITYVPDILVGHCGECVVQGPNQINFL